LYGQTVTAGAGTFPSEGESTDISTKTPLFRYFNSAGYPNIERNIEKRITIKKDFNKKTHFFSISPRYLLYAIGTGQLVGLTEKASNLHCTIV
jgi:hypothetical protein